MKKSRSSIPLFEARWPGLAGKGGPRDDDAGLSRVAIAVGKTLKHIY